MAGTLKGELLKRINLVEENVSLQQFSGLGTGGSADFFAEVHDTVELIEAVKAAIGCNLPYMVVATGQNILFSDGGFPGLVIHNLAQQSVLDADQSQMIVDSGFLLQEFITKAASQGFGGLTGLYRQGGSMGGAIYRNAQVANQHILSSVRYVTLLLPPTKMKVDVSVVRYHGDWFFKENENGRRLQQIHQAKTLEEPRAIILNAHIQLTSVRSDELLRRIHQEAVWVHRHIPRGTVFGPLFEEVPGRDLQEILIASGVSKIRVSGMMPDRKNANFIRRKKGLLTAQAVWEYVQAIQEAAKDTTGVELAVAFERLGAW